MLKLLLLTAGLASLLKLYAAVNFTATPELPAASYCPMPCHTLNEYAANVSLFQGQANISIVLLSGIHHLNQDLRISRIKKVTIQGLNRLQNATIIIHNETRIMVSDVDDFKLIDVCIQADNSSRQVNQTIQLLNANKCIPYKHLYGRY